MRNRACCESDLAVWGLLGSEHSAREAEVSSLSLLSLLTALAPQASSSSVPLASSSLRAASISFKSSLDGLRSTKQGPGSLVIAQEQSPRGALIPVSGF